MSQTSMSRSRRSFSAVFKDELRREVIVSSKPIGEVAKACGIGDSRSALQMLTRRGVGLGRHVLRLLDSVSGAGARTTGRRSARAVVLPFSRHF